MQGLKEDSVAECLFDTYKSARITFQFGIKEDTAEDIAEKMVWLKIIHLGTIHLVGMQNYPKK